VLPVFDPQTGAVTGFTVTSPGWNYTEAKIVLHDGRSEDRVLDCVLAENGAGAFRKSGPGTLILGRENSWSGDTVLEDGVLKCGEDGALPAGGTVVLAGGRLDMNGKKLSDGSTAPLAWAVDIADVLAKGTAVLYNGDIDFADGATLTVRNVQLLEGSDARRVDLLTVTGSTGSMPVTVSAPTANWRIVWQNGRLIARRNRGVFVIVR
jgi:autotransporter-associated beta strand protein